MSCPFPLFKDNQILKIKEQWHKKIITTETKKSIDIPGMFFFFIKSNVNTYSDSPHEESKLNNTGIRYALCPAY